MKASSASAKPARVAKAARGAKSVAARARAEPLTNLHFQVGIERLGESGVFEVVLPTARIVDLAGQRRGTELGPLTLRRALTESADWYRWWDEARRSRSVRPRVVTINVLRSAGGPLGVRWFFRDAVPAAYEVSPLNALLGAPLIETLEVKVGGFELYERE